MIILRDSATFGEAVFKQFMAEGWGSLSKRDLELLLFVLLEKDGAVDRAASNYVLGKQLRLTQARVAAFRRDAYARWRPLIAERSEDVVIRVLRHALSEMKLETTARYASERKMQEGFIPLLIEHPDDRLEVENAIKKARGVPVYERNREVLLIHYKTLVEIASELQILEERPNVIRRRLKEMLGEREDLQKFLTKPIKEITAEDARDALNIGLAGAVAETPKMLGSFLKTFISASP